MGEIALPLLAMRRRVDGSVEHTDAGHLSRSRQIAGVFHRPTRRVLHLQNAVHRVIAIGGVQRRGAIDPRFGEDIAALVIGAGQRARGVGQGAQMADAVAATRWAVVSIGFVFGRVAGIGCGGNPVQRIVGVVGRDIGSIHRLGDIPRAIIGIGGGPTVRAHPLVHVTEAVIGVGGDVIVRVGHAEHPAVGVIGGAGHAASGIGYFDDPVKPVIGLGRLTAQLVLDDLWVAVGVVLDNRCVLIDAITRVIHALDVIGDPAEDIIGRRVAISSCAIGEGSAVGRAELIAQQVIGENAGLLQAIDHRLQPVGRIVVGADHRIIGKGRRFDQATAPVHRVTGGEWAARCLNAATGQAHARVVAVSRCNIVGIKGFERQAARRIAG